MCAVIVYDASILLAACSLQYSTFNFQDYRRPRVFTTLLNTTKYGGLLVKQSKNKIKERLLVKIAADLLPNANANVLILLMHPRNV